MLRARDVMQTQVVTVSPSLPLAELELLLEREEVSPGCPWSTTPSCVVSCRGRISFAPSPTRKALPRLHSPTIRGRRRGPEPGLCRAHGERTGRGQGRA
jgi:hypothetical protein